MAYGQDRNQKTLEGPGIYTWLLGFFMAAQFAAVSFPDIALLSYSKELNLFVFGSIWMAKLFFSIVAISHVFEAVIAWFFVKTMDPPNASFWFWQTLFLGYLSLHCVIKRLL